LEVKERSFGKFRSGGEINRKNILTGRLRRGREDSEEKCKKLTKREIARETPWQGGKSLPPGVSGKRDSQHRSF